MVQKILASLTQPIKSNLPARGQDILLLVPSQASNSWRVAKEGSQGSLLSHPVKRSWYIPMYFVSDEETLTENDELQHHQCPWKTLNHPYKIRLKIPIQNSDLSLEKISFLSLHSYKPPTFQMAIWIQVPPILNPGLGPLSTIHLTTEKSPENKKSPGTYNLPENENLPGNKKKHLKMTIHQKILEWQIQLMHKQKTNTNTKWNFTWRKSIWTLHVPTFECISIRPRNPRVYNYDAKTSGALQR